MLAVSADSFQQLELATTGFVYSTSASGTTDRLTTLNVLQAILASFGASENSQWMVLLLQNHIIWAVINVGKPEF